MGMDNAGMEKFRTGPYRGPHADSEDADVTPLRVSPSMSTVRDDPCQEVHKVERIQPHETCSP